MRPGMAHLKKIIFILFNLKGSSPVSFSLPNYRYFKNNSQIKIVFFSGIETWIIEAEGEHADHWTTTAK